MRGFGHEFWALQRISVLAMHSAFYIKSCFLGMGWVVTGVGWVIFLWRSLQRISIAHEPSLLN